MTNNTDNRLILLSDNDNVLVARVPISEGELINVDGAQVRVAAALTMGHKLARRAISVGDKVLKYGAPIGSATAQINPGDLVHIHNIKSNYTATHSLEAELAAQKSEAAE